MTYFNAGYMAGALGLSLCHYVLALSSYVRGISVITPPPYGGGDSWGVSLCCHFFFLYRLPTNIL